LNPYDLSFLTDDVLAVQRAHQRDWEMLCRGEQPDHVPLFTNGRLGLPWVAPYKIESWLAEELAFLRAHMDAYRNKAIYHVLGLTLDRYDLHFGSAVMGCRVSGEDGGPVWWDTLQNMGRRMQDFEAVDLDQCQPFQSLLRDLKFVVEATEGLIPVELPYLGDALLEAVNLFGQDFLLSLAADPGLANRLLERVTRTILEMRRRFLAVAPAAPLCAHGMGTRPLPPGYTLLYECSTQLISAETYQRFVQPWDVEVAGCQARGFGIHLCGRHTQHLGAWREIPALRAFQLNGEACADLEVYCRESRPDQFIIYWPSEKYNIDYALRLTGGRRIAVLAEIKGG
jgi:hypothetical protein